MTGPEYFRYFPNSPELKIWGLGVTATGLARDKPGPRGPPLEHPADHQFDWQHGRILEAMQILLVTQGRGIFETRVTGPQKIDAGMAFLVLPKVWHRYRADAKTGWEVSWVEVQGPVVDALLCRGVFNASTAVRRDSWDGEFEEAFEMAHRCARTAMGGFMPELSAAAYRMLTICARTRNGRLHDSRIERAMREAERFLDEHHAEALDLRGLAKRLGVAYSYFRRAFGARTGFAPWQYVLHLRLSRARRMLASSDVKLEELALRLGFSSAFHFSASFKKAFGSSPDRWRRELWRGEKVLDERKRAERRSKKPRRAPRVARRVK